MSDNYQEKPDSFSFKNCIVKHRKVDRRFPEVNYQFEKVAKLLGCLPVPIKHFEYEMHDFEDLVEFRGNYSSILYTFNYRII